MKDVIFILMIFCLSGCATYLENVPLSKIPDKSTAMTGRITAERNFYYNGRKTKSEESPYTDLSIGLQHFDKIEDVPERIYVYSNILRMNTDKSGNISLIINSGNYFAADVAMKFFSFPYGKLVELTKTKGVAGTLNFSVREGAVNYFGHIHIIENVERFEDKNADGYIDKSEFNSNRVPFSAMSRGSDRFPADSYWESLQFVVSDESNLLPKVRNLSISLATQQQYYNF